MQQIITPFSLRYDGNDADGHSIDALQFAQSLMGASRIYNVTTHYCLFGEVPKGNFKRDFSSYVSVPREGCYEAFIVIAASTPHPLMYAEIGKEALTQVFYLVVGTIKRLWTTNKPEAEVTKLTEALIRSADSSAELNKILANGIIRSNNDLSALHGRLIDTIPTLASSLRPSGRHLVAPIGKSCKSISQFQGTPFATNITEAEADVIRTEDNLEIEDMDNFKCTNIMEINLNTGHCEMLVEGIEGVVKGTISDPILNTPGNVYTQALDQHAPFSFSAKPVKKDGKIHRLYISDAKEES